MRRLRPDGPLARPLVPESLYRTCSYIIEFDFSASFFGVKCIVFTTAELSRERSGTLCGPQHTNSVQGFAWRNAFRFCKVHETSRTLKVTCGVRQGQEEVYIYISYIYMHVFWYVLQGTELRRGFSIHPWRPSRFELHYRKADIWMLPLSRKLHPITIVFATTWATAVQIYMMSCNFKHYRATWFGNIDRNSIPVWEFAG